MVERFIAPVLKTGDRNRSGGSNPSSSADNNVKSFKSLQMTKFAGFFVFGPFKLFIISHVLSGKLVSSSEAEKRLTNSLVTN